MSNVSQNPRVCSLLVRYYAGAAAAAGADEETLELNQDRVSLAEVLETLARQRPALRRVFPQCSFLWAGRRIETDQELSLGTDAGQDTLEVLPPFAGG